MMLRITALILTLISIVFVFFHYNGAIFIFGAALALLGMHELTLKNKRMMYIYFISGLIFMVGIIVKGF
ncbi:hypothetical protein [Bacillus sp. FJAT-50079]|uniref:hypothetical protein n=1 Tax=Bacillus sp. FJAT-50079 TaxID=2833577 RepID=UPI001BC8D278|nr:hypothetical protein [Bacillus sp. FJAT-50079]MBS4207049.1 hypothetical protein [Bacillus sp. FJAT-50079]